MAHKFVNNCKLTVKYDKSFKQIYIHYSLNFLFHITMEQVSTQLICCLCPRIVVKVGEEIYVVYFEIASSCSETSHPIYPIIYFPMPLNSPFNLIRELSADVSQLLAVFDILVILSSRSVKNEQTNSVNSVGPD